MDMTLIMLQKHFIKIGDRDNSTTTIRRTKSRVCSGFNETKHFNTHPSLRRNKKDGYKCFRKRKCVHSRISNSEFSETLSRFSTVSVLYRIDTMGGMALISPK